MMERQGASSFHCEDCGAEGAEEVSFWLTLSDPALVPEAGGKLKMDVLFCGKCGLSHCFTDPELFDGDTDHRLKVVLYGVVERKQSISDYFAGDYEAIVNGKSGHVQFRELHSAQSTTGDLSFLRQLDRLRHGFRCRECGQEKLHTSIVHSSEGKDMSHRAALSLQLLFLACDHCKLVKVYNADVPRFKRHSFFS